jgi:hypothetical protein
LLEGLEGFALLNLDWDGFGSFHQRQLSQLALADGEALLLQLDRQF